MVYLRFIDRNVQSTGKYNRDGKMGSARLQSTKRVRESGVTTGRATKKRWQKDGEESSRTVE